MKLLEYVLSLYQDAQKNNFFGKIILEFRNGKLILVRLEETKIPPSYLE